MKNNYDKKIYYRRLFILHLLSFLFSLSISVFSFLYCVGERERSSAEGWANTHNKEKENG